MSANREGFRGYIASRRVRGEAMPQHVQNLVIRDYAARREMQFLLSATEYAMPGCYMILEALLDEIDRLEGVICFSLFMLPPDAPARGRIYERVLGGGASLHGALENMAIESEADARALEDIFLVDRFACRDLREVRDVP